MSLSKLILPLKSAVEELKQTQGWKDAWKSATTKGDPDLMANCLVEFVSKRSKIEERMKEHEEEPKSKRPKKGLKPKEEINREFIAKITFRLRDRINIATNTFDVNIAITKESIDAITVENLAAPSFLQNLWKDLNILQFTADILTIRAHHLKGLFLKKVMSFVPNGQKTPFVKTNFGIDLCDVCEQIKFAVLLDAFPNLYLTQCSFWELTSFASVIIKTAADNDEFRGLIGHKVKPIEIRVAMKTETLEPDEQAQQHLNAEDYDPMTDNTPDDERDEAYLDFLKQAVEFIDRDEDSILDDLERLAHE